MSRPHCHRRRETRFLEAFRRFEETIAWNGAQNGLIETVLKLTVPGVPDIYQGAELWEQSMVDPDNRRTGRFRLRRQLLRGLSGNRLDCPDDFRNGAIKLAVTSELLAYRALYPALFADGTYEPVDVSGPDSDRILAFQRQEAAATVFSSRIALGPWRGPPSATLGKVRRYWRDLLRDSEMAPERRHP